MAERLSAEDREALDRAFVADTHSLPELRRHVRETVERIVAAAVAEERERIAAGMTVTEQWGVRYGDSERIKSQGEGPSARYAAEREAARIAHNATLPNFGQPKSGTVVHRTVSNYTSATEWTEAEEIQ